MGLLRTDATGELAPLPDANAIAELVESFRRAGSTVELTVAGELGALGPARGLAACRIVQEALTNATRHAPGEPRLGRDLRRPQRDHSHGAQQPGDRLLARDRRRTARHA